MAAVNILKSPVSSPADVSPLQELISAGYNPSQILGVIGRTEGNGCVNDFSRTLSSHVWEPLVPSSAITIFSGGTEGVLCPHVTFIVKESRNTGLVAAVGRTRVLEAHEVGTLDHVWQVAETVESMLADSKIDRARVRLVLIKCPLLTSTKLQSMRAAGRLPITNDTYDSMAKSRYASALGISVALGELDKNEADDALSSGQSWSDRASCSSGAELEDCHILILASSQTPGPLNAVSTSMTDAIDAGAFVEILDMVTSRGGEVVQVFAKAEASPEGHIRGKRHTMNTDSDIHSTRHARAAVGGLLCGLTGDTMLYVSGGAEGQGPPGGGSLCVVIKRSST